LRKMGKEPRGRPGQEMLGSTGLHAWLESGVYVQQVGDIEQSRTIYVRTEFKSAPSSAGFEVHFPPMDRKYLPEYALRAEAVEKRQREKRENSESKRESQFTRNKERVLSSLIKKAQNTQELVDALDIGRSTVQKITKELMSEGQIALNAKPTHPGVKFIHIT
jgi:hypothetical protein